MKQSGSERTAKRGRAKGEQHERDGRRQRESGPCREATKISGAHQPDGKADLTARRPGQELAQRDQIGIGLFVEPAAARDELVTEISDMRDRPAERAQAKLEKDQQNLEASTFLRAFRLQLVDCRRHGIPTPVPFLNRGCRHSSSSSSSSSSWSSSARSATWGVWVWSSQSLR
jgi:hypothetical protein